MSDFLSSYFGFINKPVCAVYSDEISGLLNLIYTDGKFYSVLNDVKNWGTCSGVALKDNNFLVGFRKLLQECGAKHVWVYGTFTGEKDSGVMYYVDSYNIPWKLCAYVDPYSEDSEADSSMRSYCTSTNMEVPKDMYLIYEDGIFYEGV